MNYRVRAFSQYIKRDYASVISGLSDAIRIDPDSGETYNDRGLAYLWTGDYDRAIADFGAAILLGLGPYSAGAFAGRGYAYFRKGDKERALADLDDAVRLDPGYVPAFAYRGEVHEARGERARAMADYNKALCLPTTNDLRIEMQAAVRRRLEALQAAPAPCPALPKAGPVERPGQFRARSTMSTLPRAAATLAAAPAGMSGPSAGQSVSPARTLPRPPTTASCTGSTRPTSCSGRRLRSG